jgi:hypothetical protein
VSLEEKKLDIEEQKLAMEEKKSLPGRMSKSSCSMDMEKMSEKQRQ